MAPMIGGKVKECQHFLLILIRAGNTLGYVNAYFSEKVVSAAFRASAPSRHAGCSFRSDFTPGAFCFGKQFSTFFTLWPSIRWCFVLEKALSSAFQPIAPSRRDFGGR